MVYKFPNHNQKPVLVTQQYIHRREGIPKYLISRDNLKRHDNHVSIKYIVYFSLNLTLYYCPIGNPNSSRRTKC